ncbi:hypothetical protein GDO86_009966 [Hymenochirus boettgeri]|uniref:C2H2-type domain-containing protein n=1 Tax=Hymenochirus boettgeri TaxID=247094 RepID=A0A8T2JR28_9PIPI|nr:hypothetical protein GDO86_009966 [Hymenochirus boettgeri]
MMDLATPSEDNPIHTSQSHYSEHDIEFISEGPLRPVLECIDLLSSDEETNSRHNNGKLKDEVDRQKDKVASTLERLARHVEVERKQRARKNKAFQEKLHNQHAHGLQELEFIKGLPGTDAARICVNQWLKMPGLKPGVVCSSRRPLLQSTEQSLLKSQSITCPIMNCNRKYDNHQLLFGHLKRFDHSPCDPTITLHGVPGKSYACVVCLKQFLNIKEYEDHIDAEASLNDGHTKNLAPQVIQCFGCPTCFLLFNLRDECLQHMSESNHFTCAIKLGEKGLACPIPFPMYAKKVLIALCKDIPFQVMCTSCYKELRSHMELSAHFRTHCRKAGSVARPKKSTAEVAMIFVMKAYCLVCKEMLECDIHIMEHIQRTNHKPKMITSLEESILGFCYANEENKTPAELALSTTTAKSKMLKRTLNNCNRASSLENSSIMSCIENRTSKSDGVGITVTAWFCECLQKFITEKEAEKHIMLSNRICHKCLVCKKLTAELSIIQLHMSRFHGGAHLNNFTFWCQTCLVELPRVENIMAHVCEFHRGHSYYFEQETFEEEQCPSTSTQHDNLSQSCIPESSVSSTRSPEGHWQCHLCEEMFDSENSVQQHCKNIGIHQFHKFCCDICKQRFQKIETLYRHSQHQHSGDIQVKYFCGLCGDLYFNKECEFQSHYEDLHGLEYGYVAELMQSSIKDEEQSIPRTVLNEDRLTCGCLENYTSNEKKKEDSSLCLARLLQNGNLWYSCCFCTATGQILERFKNHYCSNDQQPLSKDFVVKCSCCSKSFQDTEGAQQHFHTKHCLLQKHHPLRSSNNPSSDNKIKPPPAVKIEMPTEDSKEKMDTEDEALELPELDLLCTMTHIVFVDLEYWVNFFTRLPGQLNQGIFVWGFQGGKNNWKPPVNCKILKYLSTTGSFYLHPHCSARKVSAICVHAGRLHAQLPMHIAFTILSSDKEFLKLESQFREARRPCQILDPHHQEGDVMCAVLNNISDTVQDVHDGNMETELVLDEDADLKEAIRRSMNEM